MSISTMRMQIPEGVRDRLPREAAQMRRLSAQLDQVYRAWGYREVATPGLEYLETVTAGESTRGRSEDLYQLFDRRGRTLALRPDMTTPIARLAATKLANEPKPLRLAYFAPVYRHRDYRAGSTSEIWQAGVELIGAPGVVADAEVVALACAAIAATGLKGFRIGLGHVAIVEGLFAYAGVTTQVAKRLRAAMVARDLVAFEQGILQAGLAQDRADLLLALVHFHGDYEQAVNLLQGVGGQVAEALRHLGQLLQLLKALGVSEQVTLDLGLVRSLSYYTGLVFEGYLPGIGAPVVGGGRYDNLLAEFGTPEVATGFGLEVDRLLAAQEQQIGLPVEPGLDALVACPPGREAEAMAWAWRLRQQGLTVEVDLLGRTGAELAAYARARGAGRLLTPGVDSIH